MSYQVSNADIGRYFIHDDGKNELIIAVDVNANTLQTNTTTVHADSTNAKIRDRLCAHAWHTGFKKHIIQIGQKVYIADWDQASWTEIYCQTPDTLPAIVPGRINFRGDMAYLWDDNGIFEIDIDNGTFAKVNIARDQQSIVDVAKTDDTPYGYRYLYTLTAQKGNTLLDRTQNTVLQETAPNALDSNNKDYAERWVSSPVGPGTQTYGVLTSGQLDLPGTAVSQWESISNGQVGFVANGLTYNIICDFSGCGTFNDVADRIQTALRQYWPDAKFEFSGVGDDHFVFTMPNAGDTVDYCVAGSAGTDISGDGYLNMAEPITSP